jgi:hypothetical protein
MKLMQEKFIKDEKKFIEMGYVVISKTMLPIIPGMPQGQGISVQEDKVTGMEGTFMVRKEIQKDQKSMMDEDSKK